MLHNRLLKTRNSMIFVVVLGLVALALLSVNTAHASSSTPITITITSIDFSVPHPTGTFVARAPLCPSGTFIDHIVNVEIAKQYLIDRTLTCDDGSGTFDILFHVLFTRLITGSAPWSVNSGTGAYTTLHGTGMWSGDTLTGEVHFD